MSETKNLRSIAEIYKSDKIDESEYLLCTGLFDEHDRDIKCIPAALAF